MQPSTTRVIRIVLASVASCAGFISGIGYCHKCDAGIKALEAAMPFLVPVLCICCLALISKLAVAVLASAALLTCAILLKEPYMKWAHHGLSEGEFLSQIRPMGFQPTTIHPK
jgi:hypothetical protein